MKRIEYLSAKLPNPPLDSNITWTAHCEERDSWLNSYGTEGWEAINILYGTDGLYVIFKREL
jgi:hypothetical protein